MMRISRIQENQIFLAVSGRVARIVEVSNLGNAVIERVWNIYLQMTGLFAIIHRWMDGWDRG
jgi:hypothetical protein